MTDSAKTIFHIPSVVEVLAYVFPLCPEVLKHSLESGDVGLLNSRPLPSQSLGQVSTERQAAVDPVRAAWLSIWIDRGKYLITGQRLTTLLREYQIMHVHTCSLWVSYTLDSIKLHVMYKFFVMRLLLTFLFGDLSCGSSLAGDSAEDGRCLRLLTVGGGVAATGSL